MLKTLYANMSDNIDIYLQHCGIQDCEPGHSYGPAVRDYYLIHYISNGEGMFVSDGETYRLKQGQGFLICPEVVSYYEADSENPWSYAWVGFNGIKADHYLQMTGLSRKNPIFTYNTDSYLSDCIVEMVESSGSQSGRDLRFSGLLNLFISKLIENNGYSLPAGGTSTERADYYVNQAIKYMKANYTQNISISGIASSIGLDRSYLGALFKKKLDLSPRKYLLNLRIEKACRLIANENLTIGDISRSVGFNDPLHFSKMFKKTKNVSPMEYRKKIIEERRSGLACY